MDAYPTLPLLTVPLGKRRITGIDKWLSAAWVEEWKHRDPNQHAFICSGIHTAHQAKGGNWQVDQAVASLHLHFWMYAGKTIWWWAHERTRAHLHSHSKKKGQLCIAALRSVTSAVKMAIKADWEEDKSMPAPQRSWSTKTVDYVPLPNK